jgi:hypothetical protein
METDRAVIVRVGHEAYSFIALEIDGYEQPDTTWPVDANRLLAVLRYHAIRTGGSLPITIETQDLAQLRRQLLEAHTDLGATISFAPSSGYFSLIAEGDGRGHYAMRCSVGRGSRGVTIASFEIEFDQSYLPEIIEQLDEALERYPTR